MDEHLDELVQDWIVKTMPPNIYVVKILYGG